MDLLTACEFALKEWEEWVNEVSIDRELYGRRMAPVREAIAAAKGQAPALVPAGLLAASEEVLAVIDSEYIPEKRKELVAMFRAAVKSARANAETIRRLSADHQGPLMLLPRESSDCTPDPRLRLICAALAGLGIKAGPDEAAREAIRRAEIVLDLEEKRAAKQAL